MRRNSSLPGSLIISLDFELYWGVRDQKPLESYRDNLLGVRQVIPALLDLFRDFGIHATWATVGFLFFDSRDELLANLPDRMPEYVDKSLFPGQYLQQIGMNERDDPFHYGASLVRLISSYPHQEVGSHTFSHYYCLEPGQNAAMFQSDLSAAIKVARKYNLKIESLVFPRNQVNVEYLPVCGEMGIKAFRGSESSWLYAPRSQRNESIFRRGLRLVDAYVNISGHNCYGAECFSRQIPFNLPSSRFLRPASRPLRFLEPLRLRRIKSDLTYAAHRGLTYHLWWHPHNFGKEPKRNLKFLGKILSHFSGLREQYGMESLNMGEVAVRLAEAKSHAA